jgi:predicted DNA-binding transcriptional regulator AlpA
MANFTAAPRMVAWPSTAITAWLRERLQSAGADPASVPDEPFRLLRRDEVLHRCGISSPTLYRRMRRGKFPRPVSLD